MAKERSPPEELMRAVYLMRILRSVGIMLFLEIVLGIYSGGTEFVKEKTSSLLLVLGIGLEIYLGGCVSALVEFLTETESALGVDVVIGISLVVYFGGYISDLVKFLEEKKSAVALGIALEIYLGGYVSALIELLEENESIVLGVGLAAYFGPHTFVLVELFEEKKSALVLVFMIGLEIYLGGSVYALVAFLAEKESAVDIILVFVIAWETCLGEYVLSVISDFLENRRRGRGRIADGPTAADTQAFPVSRVWHLDSCAQCHATGDLRLFVGQITWTDSQSWVYGVSGKDHKMTIRGYGTVQFAHFTLQVNYVPGLTRNFICVAEIQEKLCCRVTLGKDSYIDEEGTGKRICEIRTVDKLYELDSL